MKNILIIHLLLMYFTFSISGKTKYEIDSLRIMGMQYDGELQFPITRYNFLDEFNEMKTLWKETNDEMRGKCLTYSDSIVLCQVAYVDTVIKSNTEILSIFSSISRLKKERKLKVKSNQNLSKAYYIHDKSRIIWSPLETLDNRLLIVLFHEDTTEFVWLDAYYADKGKFRYELSNELREIMSKYTHIYDRFFK